MEWTNEALAILNKNVGLIEENNGIQLFANMAKEYSNYYDIWDTIIEICTNPEINIPITTHITKDEFNNLTLDDIFVNDHIDASKIAAFSYFVGKDVSFLEFNYKIYNLINDKYGAITEKIVNNGYKFGINGISGICQFMKNIGYRYERIIPPIIHIDNNHTIQDKGTLEDVNNGNKYFVTIEELEEYLEKQEII